MYILKNAWTSIVRNKGRNILIAVIFIIVALSCSITLAIRNSANTLISSYKNKYEVEATIGVDRKSMMEMGKNNEQDTEEKTTIESMKDIYSNISSLTSEEIENYGNSQYVKSYYYTSSIGLNSNTVEKAEMTINENEINSSGNETKVNKMNPNMGIPDIGGIRGMTNTDFTLTGYSTYNAMTDFINGKYKITEGKVSEDFTSFACVINKELAEINEIKVGDKITLTNPNDETKTFDFFVTGIFEENSTDTESKMSMFSNSANTIITNTTAVKAITDTDTDISINVTPTFILTSKDVVEAFTSEIQEKGLNEYLTVTTNLDKIESATDSISNVLTFATTFLIITVVIGAVVLFVINMINLRERKYEIGVYRTIGMKKITLTMQFLCELLMVSLIGLLVGTFIGSLCSVKVSNALIEQEITSSQKATNEIGKNFGDTVERFGKDNKISGVQQINAFESIDAVVDIKVLFELVGIGLVLTFLSSISFMISIERFSPLTILKERS